MVFLGILGRLAVWGSYQPRACSAKQMAQGGKEVDAPCCDGEAPQADAEQVLDETGTGEIGEDIEGIEIATGDKALVNFVGEPVECGKCEGKPEDARGGMRAGGVAHAECHERGEQAVHEEVDDFIDSGEALVDVCGDLV